MGVPIKRRWIRSSTQRTQALGKPNPGRAKAAEQTNTAACENQNNGDFFTPHLALALPNFGGDGRSGFTRTLGGRFQLTARGHNVFAAWGANRARIPGFVYDVCKRPNPIVR